MHRRLRAQDLRHQDESDARRERDPPRNARPSHLVWPQILPFFFLLQFQFQR